MDIRVTPDVRNRMDEIKEVDEGHLTQRRKYYSQVKAYYCCNAKKWPKCLFWCRSSQEKNSLGVKVEAEIEGIEVEKGVVDVNITQVMYSSLSESKVEEYLTMLSEDHEDVPALRAIQKLWRVVYLVDILQLLLQS